MEHGEIVAEDRDTANGSRRNVRTRMLRRKEIADLAAGSGDKDGLRRSLGLAHLTMLSVGATLGTGIFVVLGEAIPLAGPAIVLSFVLAGITALFAALCYAELAGMIPASGSSYSYAYVTLGELVAWVCGWCLLLEYGVSVAATAVELGTVPQRTAERDRGVDHPGRTRQPPGEGGVFNLPAVVVVIVTMFVLLGGAPGERHGQRRDGA